MKDTESASLHVGALLLVGVDVMGMKRCTYLYFNSLKKAKAKYVKYVQEVNEGIEDPRLMYAIHATTSENEWPDKLPNVHHRGGYAPDRSCDPERCDCKVLGFPVHLDPHVPSHSSPSA